MRLRARRLGLGNAPVRLASATSVRDILTTLGEGAAPDLLVIDSIQTMHSDLIEGAPGTVSQVRASAQELIRFAKERGTAVVLDHAFRPSPATATFRARPRYLDRPLR